LGYVLLDDLQAGMVLGDDLFTEKGQFVLAKGVELEERHLQALRRFGILEVDIVGTSQSELDGGELDPVLIEESVRFQQARFSLNDRDHEVVSEVFELACEQTARRLQSGWKPAVANLPETLGEDLDWSNKPTSEDLVRGKVKLASLPDVYSKIVEALNVPGCAANHLAEIVSKDSSISVRLLKLVNSAFYSLTSKVDSISRAITLLGTRELLSLALGISIVRLFRTIPTELIDMEAFWKHSIRTGLFARQLARRKGLEETEMFFVGGLLHDIGRLVMLVEMPEFYARALVTAQREGLAIYQAERQELAYDHGQIGRMLGELWRLSRTLSQMIGWHHKPQGDRFSEETCIVHLADFMAHALGAETNLASSISPFNPRAWEVIDLPVNILAPASQHVERHFIDISRTFLADD